jgi:hypothetical protein
MLCVSAEVGYDAGARRAGKFQIKKNFGWYQGLPAYLLRRSLIQL